MFEFPPDYKLYDRLPPWSPLDDLMEFLYQYDFLKIHGQGNTHYSHTELNNEVYFKFVSEDCIKLFEILLVLHMENALTVRLRLPKKSEGEVRDGFLELLKPYNEKVSFFKYRLDTEELYHDFDELKKRIHDQDTLFIDILIHGYVFTKLFFKAVGEEKGIESSGTPEESRLMERIGNIISHNPDSQEEITLHYKIEDYISKYYLDYPIIYDLAENGFLEVKDIVFQNTEINFILHRFNNFPTSQKTIPSVVHNINVTQNLSQKISLENTLTQNIVNVDYKENETRKGSKMEYENNSGDFILHEKSRELVLGNIKYKFKNDSLIFRLTSFAFQYEKNEHIGYEEFLHKYGDHAKNKKDALIEISTCISKYNKIFSERFGKKDFFGTGSGYYYKQY